MHRQKHSAETKLRISLAKKGKPSNRKGVVLSKETRELISKKNKGFRHSLETRQKMSESRKGEGNGFYGKKLSEDRKAQLRAYRLGKEPANKKYFTKEEAKRAKSGSASRRYLLLRDLIKSGATHTNGEWETLKAQYNFACPACKDEKKILTKDHIIPLSKGGTDRIENIQPLCQSCNSKKHTIAYKYQNGK